VTWITVMIELKQFDFFRQRHGGYASWAAWASPSGKPKSNIGDISIFNLENNSSLLDTLKVDVVMVGLNISRLFSEPFRNFHDPNPRANDFKIRYAFMNTKYYGAYMTDIIKNVEMVNSKDLLKYLKVSPSLIRKNIEAFRGELRDLNFKKPTILVFGVAVYKIILDNIGDNEYSRLIKLTHYSHQISKEKYREMVLTQIDQELSVI
jgi:hypothetical protein